jgi:hypothetical protein
MRCLSLRDHSSCDALLHEQAAAGAAHVALVEVDAVDDAFDGLVDGASAKTMLAALPPSSRVASCRCRRWRGDELADLGAAGERDLVDAGVVDERRAGGARPVTMLTTPSGSSASWMISASSSAVSGVVSAGLSTTVLPQASAGAIFQAAMSSGKFHGMIWPATPSGCGGGPGKA